MIIVQLIGGLGNQMFQYAAGRRLAMRHNTEIKIDISGFKTYTLHDYRLDHFRIKNQIATNKEITALKRVWSTGLMGALARRFIPQKKSYIQERSPKIFNADILALPDNVYLEGYWQSEKYFQDIAPIIRKEYSLKDLLTPQSAAAVSAIKNSIAVSLHVRRADYITDQSAGKTYGVLGPAYYKAAVDKLANKVKNFTLYVFSDDSVWARKNLKFDFPTTYLDFNGRERNYEDLYLMSLCKHYIIANSTFSWWGAWLGTASDKIVIAPREWFRGKDETGGDRYPNNWILV